MTVADDQETIYLEEVDPPRYRKPKIRSIFIKPVRLGKFAVIDRLRPRPEVYQDKTLVFSTMKEARAYLAQLAQHIDKKTWQEY